MSACRLSTSYSPQTRRSSPTSTGAWTRKTRKCVVVHTKECAEGFDIVMATKDMGRADCEIAISARDEYFRLDSSKSPVRQDTTACAEAARS